MKGFPDQQKNLCREDRVSFFSFRDLFCPFAGSGLAFSAVHISIRAGQA
jgi:hypothetical protein